MADGLHFREYRASASRFMPVFLPAWVGLIVCAVGLGLVDGVPIWGKILVMAPLFAVLGLVHMWIVRASTATTRDHIAVRGPFGTKTIAWPDIQGIDVEYRTAPIDRAGVPLDEGEPFQVVVVYNRIGRKIQLPSLSNQSVDGFEHEVSSLRTTWEQLRGADWAPLPAVAAAMTKTRKENPWLAALGPAMVWAIVAIPVGAAILVPVMLISGVWNYPGPDGLLAILASPWMITLGPAAVVFVVSFSTSMLRRKL